MKNLSARHGNSETFPSETASVPGLTQNSKPNNGDPALNEQIKQLTPREIEVLQFVAEGKLNKQAASELLVSIKTIEKHREHLMKKLGIRGIAGLTHFAIFTGIVQCNPQLAMAWKTTK